ncbi:hypothetical protein N7478_005607 [Penicillium angulare]|uniref:uncharacterized protein n=1 Tax=Penicillium angulare TaxID=116970 RepID=UPI0025423DF2|nr:uncharacterized protein N7478_005607 [Penicillium angulare]KAJ5280235.1 hypothetical protein N7478_005607 [Penicillium angulare]
MSAASSASGQFSETTKLETRRLAGNGCWSCETTRVDICYVIAKEDTQTEVWEQAGLFKFQYKTAANAIPLCGACHAEFDCAIDPGYVFFPDDLQYFIDYETKDQQRRQRCAAETGQPVERKAPTATEYLAYQMNANLVPSDAVGGLYRRVFLKRFLHGGTVVGLEHLFSMPRQWHGAPMASIRRALATLGSPRSYIIDPSTRGALEKLRELYFGDESPSPFDVPLRELYRSDAIKSANKRHPEERDEGASGRAKRARGLEVGQSMGLTEDAGSTNRCAEHPDWVLGPHITTNEVVRLYGPLFSPT